MRELGHADPEVRLSALETIGEAGGDPRYLHPLLDHLGDPEWRVRQVVIQILKGYGRVRLLVRHLVGLLGTEEKTRNSALEVLVGLGQEAVPHLLVLLHSSLAELGLAKFIVETLGSIGDRTAGAVLLPLLSHADENLRIAAIEALGKLKEPAAVEPLVEILDLGGALPGFAAIKALQEIGDPRAVGPLLEVLERPVMRRAGMEALARLGDLRAIEPLLAGLLNDQGVKTREMALRAFALLESKHPNHPELVRRLLASYNPEISKFLVPRVAVQDEPLSRAAIRIIGLAKDVAAVPELVRLLDNQEDEGRRGDAMRALVAIGTEAIPALVAEDPEAGEARRGGAAVALGEIGKRAGATDSLISCLIRLAMDPVGHVRQSAAEALGLISAVESAEALLALLKDEYANVREAAAGALSRMENPSIVSSLLAMSRAERPEQREQAAWILGRCRERTALPSLIFLLKDSEAPVRLAAVEALGEFDQEGIAEILLPVLADEGPSVRLAAIRVLARKARAAVTDRVEALLGDSDIWVRCEAARLLDQVPGEKWALRLLDLLKDPVGAVQIAALEALAGRPDSQTMPGVAQAVLPLARHPDPEVKQAAIATLGALGDPASLPLLLACLSDPAWSVRSAAAQSLGALGNPKGIGALERLAAADPDPLVRQAAQFGLARLET